MQFHMNGFRPGDPYFSEPLSGHGKQADGLPPEVDVLIVGCGPAGLTLAAQMAAFSSINARIVEASSGPLERTRRHSGGPIRTIQAWGVIDVLAVTDFPDIHFKSLIQSGGHGNTVLIPREGGFLARFYIELDGFSSDGRMRNKNLTIDHLIAAANRILTPVL